MSFVCSFPCKVKVTVNILCFNVTILLMKKTSFDLCPIEAYYLCLGCGYMIANMENYQM